MARMAGALAGSIIAATITSHATRKTGIPIHRGGPPTISAWWWRAEASPHAAPTSVRAQAAPTIRTIARRTLLGTDPAGPPDLAVRVADAACAVIPSPV